MLVVGFQLTEYSASECNSITVCLEVVAGVLGTGVAVSALISTPSPDAHGGRLGNSILQLYYDIQIFRAICVCIKGSATLNILFLGSMSGGGMSESGMPPGGGMSGSAMSGSGNSPLLPTSVTFTGDISIFCINLDILPEMNTESFLVFVTPGSSQENQVSISPTGNSALIYTNCNNGKHT